MSEPRSVGGHDLSAGGDVMDRVAACARAALRRYDCHPDASVELLNVSENATFLVRDPGAGLSVLRVHRLGYHTEPEIASELGDKDEVKVADLKLWAEHPLAKISDDALAQAQKLGLKEPPLDASSEPPNAERFCISIRKRIMSSSSPIRTSVSATSRPVAAISLRGSCR